MNPELITQPIHFEICTVCDGAYISDAVDTGGMERCLKCGGIKAHCATEVPMSEWLRDFD